MIVIKFAHLYNKMPDDFQYSKLLDVLPVRLKDLSEYMLQYDTPYMDGGEEKHYELPKVGNI